MAQDYGQTAAGEKADVSRGDLARFWPDDLLPNTENYRFGSFDTDPDVLTERDREIEEMVVSLCTEGQKQPIIIRPVSGNRFKVHGGDTRHQAFLRINQRRIWPYPKKGDPEGMARIECVVEKCSDKDAFGSSIVENLQRNNLTVIDIANAVMVASQKHKYTDAEIYLKFRQTDPAWLPNMRRLGVLPLKYQRQIHLGKMPASVGYLLAEIPESEHEAVLADAVAPNVSTETLKPTEYVIHNDGDATNNAPGNLSVVDTLPVKCVDCGDYRPNPDNPKICAGCDQPFDYEDTAPIEPTLDYSESQAPPRAAGKPSNKTAKPKKVTARAVASAAKKRGLLAHKKISKTVAAMREFWAPVAQDRKGSLVARLAVAELAWIDGETTDESHWKEVLAILKAVK